MNDLSPYTPPNVWTWNKENGGRFANINRPIAGPTHDKDLPVGRHPLQLYSLATPNGVKVTVMLEELLALGHRGAEYDAWLIRIDEGDQFGSGFVAVNPNSKIPALLDRSGTTPIRVFESGAILLHLAEKFGAFLPTDVAARAECLSWLFWQMGSAPFLGGGFGHFYAYAPTKIEYAIDRYAMEVKRQLDVLDRHLAEARVSGRRRLFDRRHGDLALVRRRSCKGQLYEAGEFLQVQDYKHVLRWTDQIAERPAVKRGRMVNRTWGDPASQLHERHDAARLRHADTGQAGRVELTLRSPKKRHPTMITLYDCATAPSPRRARILLAEKGVAHETVQVDLRNGEQFGDAFRTVNPQCTVPVLHTDEGLLLTDNAAITAYVEARFPEPALLGAHPRKRPRSRVGTGASNSRDCCRSPKPCATAYRPWPIGRCPGRWTIRRLPNWRSVAWPRRSSSSST